MESAGPVYGQKYPNNSITLKEYNLSVLWKSVEI
jgi:hypothetical protein